MIDLICCDYVWGQEYTESEIDFYYETFLKIIIIDNHLMQYLKHRIYWRFQNLISLETIIKFIKLFPWNMTSIILDIEEIENDCDEFWDINHSFTSMNHTISKLDIYNHLIHFILLNTRVSLNLDWIIVFCPFLTNLQIDEIQAFDGTLNGLSQLQFLNIHGFTSDTQRYTSIFRLKPMQSLKHLLIIFNEGDDVETTCEQKLFDKFYNLISYYLSFICQGFHEIILHPTFRLIDFHSIISIDNVNMNVIIKMLFSLSLYDFQCLYLTLDPLNNQASTNAYRQYLLHII